VSVFSRQSHSTRREFNELYFHFTGKEFKGYKVLFGREREEVRWLTKWYKKHQRRQNRNNQELYQLEQLERRLVTELEQVRSNIRRIRETCR
jgi:hypothetical protein